MPTESKTTPAAKIDYAPFVGKTYRPNATTGLNSDRTFKIAELIPLQDFGKKGGKQPAFVLHRIPTPGVHTQACKSFLDSHTEVTEAAEAA